MLTNASLQSDLALVRDAIPTVCGDASCKLHPEHPLTHARAALSRLAQALEAMEAQLAASQAALAAAEGALKKTKAQPVFGFDVMLCPRCKRQVNA